MKDKFAAFLLFVFVSIPVAADKPVIQASYTPDKIELDGRLDEAVWTSAMKAGADMLQYEPRQGVPMSQKTEFMVVYDDENIYFGVIVNDTEPEKIVASVMERDEVPFFDDSLFLAIDTMNDNRNGYVLWTNLNGVKYDANVTNNSSLNSQWDGIWDVKTKRTNTGWQAEFKLPFSTVRQSVGPIQGRKSEPTILRRPGKLRGYKSKTKALTWSSPRMSLQTAATQEPPGTSVVTSATVSNQTGLRTSR